MAASLNFLSFIQALKNYFLGTKAKEEFINEEIGITK